MQSKLFVLLFFIFYFSQITFSSNDKNKKRKRQANNNMLNPQDQNTPNDCSQITFQSVSPSTDNLSISNAIISNSLKTKNEEMSFVPSDLLNNLLKIPNLFRYIFPYLSLFEVEFSFKCISTTFYELYEEFLREEKLLLKEHLNNKTKFLENINCKRVYFDFFEKRYWISPTRSEYANVDSFSRDLVLFPKSIRQIICFTVQEIDYKYVLLKNGHLSIFKKLKHEGLFVFISLEKDCENYESHLNPHTHKNKPVGLHLFQENVRYIEFPASFHLGFYVLLHKNDNFTQDIFHLKYDEKIIIIKPHRQSYSMLFLKNISGYMHHTDKFTNLYRFEKQDNGIYTQRFTSGFKKHVKEIESKDFEHYAEDVLCIFKTRK